MPPRVNSRQVFVSSSLARREPSDEFPDVRLQYLVRRRLTLNAGKFTINFELTSGGGADTDAAP